MVTNAIIAEIFIIFIEPFPQIQTKIQSEYALLFKENRHFYGNLNRLTVSNKINVHMSVSSVT